MPIPERRMVCLEDLICVIFQGLDSLQLKALWDADGEIEDNMIKIIHALYLIKTRP